MYTPFFIGEFYVIKVIWKRRISIKYELKIKF